MPRFITKRNPVDTKPYIVYTALKNILFSGDPNAGDPFAGGSGVDAELLYEGEHEIANATTTARVEFSIPVSGGYYSPEYAIVAISEKLFDEVPESGYLASITQFYNIRAANDDFATASFQTGLATSTVLHNNGAWDKGASDRGLYISRVAIGGVSHPDDIVLQFSSRSEASIPADGCWVTRIYAVKLNLFDGKVI